MCLLPPLPCLGCTYRISELPSDPLPPHHYHHHTRVPTPAGTSILAHGAGRMCRVRAVTIHPDHASHSSCCDSYANHIHAQWRVSADAPGGKANHAACCMVSRTGWQTDGLELLCTGRMGWHGIGSDLTHTRAGTSTTVVSLPQLVSGFGPCLIVSFSFSLFSPPPSRPSPSLAGWLLLTHTRTLLPP